MIAKHRHAFSFPRDNACRNPQCHETTVLNRDFPDSLVPIPARRDRGPSLQFYHGFGDQQAHSGLQVAASVRHRAGMLEHRGGRPACWSGGWHIYCNLDCVGQKDSPRARFTLAHELGHYYIDEHRNALVAGRGAAQDRPVAARSPVGISPALSTLSHRPQCARAELRGTGRESKAAYRYSAILSSSISTPMPGFWGI